MQEAIDNIIYSNLSNTEKISEIKKLFKEDEIIFSDLDDTIGTNFALLFSRYHFLKLIRNIQQDKIFQYLFKNFEINKNFLRIISAFEKPVKLFIISRNEHALVKNLIAHTKENFAQYGVEIIGGLGNLFFNKQHSFRINSKNKLELLPKDSVIISDAFEYNAFKDYPFFLCVDTNVNFLDRKRKYTQKLFHMMIFVLKDSWRRI